MRQDPRQPPIVLGWREWVALPQLGLPAIRAKVDTGARSSALHVDAMETFQRDGREWVRFGIHPGDGRPEAAGEAVVLDRRDVTDSGGHRTRRVFIRTRLELAGVSRLIDINLTNRRNMLFPMLLGRTAMARAFRVDPALSFVHGHPPEPLA